MPVNMDPSKRRRPAKSAKDQHASGTEGETPQEQAKRFGEENEEDREKNLADAEWKNLWDATEVIDMDKW